ncbi:hypothetical protein NPIL_186971, partial [Nephila pilipes]
MRVVSVENINRMKKENIAESEELVEDLDKASDLEFE